MERIYVFLPSILVIACIAGATFLYLKWVLKRFGNNFKSVAWHKENQWKVIWMFSTPAANVWGPAVEELVFRAPLIIAFNVVSSGAWYGIFASSGLFALIHWFGKQIGLLEIFLAREDGEHKSDDVVAETNRIHQEEGKMIIVRKVLHVIATLPLGILAGYYGIKYQSIWVSFGIHSAWNLIIPTAFPLFVLLMGWAYIGILSVWDRVSK